MTATDRIRPGDPVWLSASAGFSERAVTALEVFPDRRVRVRWEGLADPGLTVPAHWVERIRPAVGRADGPTSEAAAASISHQKQRDDHMLVLVALADAAGEGLNDFELAARYGRKATSLGVRRKELVAAGSVCYTGRKRPSDTGSPSKVWEITDLGLAALTAMRSAGAA